MTNFGTNFSTLEAKKVFTHLQKAFIKVPIFHYFDLKCHICIETNALGYAISRVLNQMTLNHLDQLFSNHITHKNLKPIFFKSEISQKHPIAFFFKK